MKAIASAAGAMLMAMAGSALSGNPILSNNMPDPHITVLDGQYWIYPTTHNGTQFKGYSSTDLQSWTDQGVVFDLANSTGGWADESGWAPAVAYKNGTYYFYYSAEAPYPNSQIGVASSTSPNGTFTDHGVLVSSDSSVEAIDPMVFIDDDGKAYLYYGGSAGSKLAIWELNANMTSTTGSRQLSSPSYFTEAPFMHKRNGTYYLTYSHGSWFNSTYSVHYSTASSPTGPWYYGGKILSSNASYCGPGHSSILQRPGRDEWYIAYHRYENGSCTGLRKTSIEPLTYNGSGGINTVTMTTTGVTSSKPPTLASGTYKIINKLSNKALDMAGCVTGNETNIIQWSYWGGNCQQWDVTPLGDGSYQILAKGTSQSLDRHACSAADDTNVKLYEYGTWNDPCQRWKIIATGDNAFKVVAKDNVNQGLDVHMCSTSNGANVKMYAHWGGDCQRWRFETP